MLGFFFGEKLEQHTVSSFVTMRVIGAHGDKLPIATDVFVDDIVPHVAPSREMGLQVAPEIITSCALRARRKIDLLWRWKNAGQCRRLTTDR